MAKEKLIKEVYGPLKLFNQKAQKLQNLSFVKQYEETRNALSIKIRKHDQYDGWSLDVDSKRASDESIEAVSLTLRFFIQNNERCSFHNLSKLYEQLEPLIGLSSQYENHRNRLHILLSQDAQPQPRKDQFDRRLLFGDVLDIFRFFR